MVCKYYISIYRLEYVYGKYISIYYRLYKLNDIRTYYIIYMWYRDNKLK